MDLCSLEGTSAISSEKIRDFLSDVSIDALTGPRRMGRENLVQYVMEAASSEGYDVSLFPDVSGKDIIFFNEQDHIIQLSDDVEIIFGQDLCHQVPAVVRCRR